MKKYCISQNNLEDKDKEEDAFIGLKEFVLYITMTQKKISYSTNENNSTKSTFNIQILDKMKVIQVETTVETTACTVDLRALLQGGTIHLVTLVKIQNDHKKN